MSAAAAPLATLAARRRLFYLCCLLPAAFYVLLVAGLPLVQGLWYSLFEYNLLRPSRSSFAGLANYARIAADPTARAAIVNTFLFTVLAVALELALGLALALLLWRELNRMRTIRPAGPRPGKRRVVYGKTVRGPWGPH